MRVHLDYGSDGLDVDVPDDRTEIVTPLFEPPVPDPRAALTAALAAPIGRPPLGTLVRAGHRVAISVCDVTRAQPRELMLEALFAAMPDVRPEDVTILIATGTHRANTADELVRMLGAAIVERYRVVNHDARDDRSLAFAGRTASDVPIWLNRHWLDADVRITTGFVEPHFFAGFSGGPKMVAPGLAGLATTLVLHDARHIGHPNATWGVTEGNPVHDDVREIARLTGVTFALDVALNRDQAITAGVRRRAVRRARGGMRARQAHGDARGAGAGGRGAHHQLRLSARPEPVPDGEGPVGGGVHRPRGRDDRLRRRMPRRRPRSRPLRPAAARASLARSAARDGGGDRVRRAGRLAGAGAGAHPAQGPGVGEGRRPLPRAVCGPRTSSRSPTSGWRCVRRSATPGPGRRWRSCPTARRRFPT